MHIISNNLCLLPLFKFNYNNIVFAVVVRSGNDEVNAFGCQWYVVLNAYSNIIVNIRVINNIAHKLHRVLP